MPLKGFDDKAFSNSKIATSKVLSDTPGNAQSMVKWGNSSKANVGLKSNTKAAVNPTSDLDENPRAGAAPQANGDMPMVPSSKGGASGDGATPGYSGSGVGLDSLKGAAMNGKC